VDGIANALGNNSSRLLIDKVSIANMVASTYGSLWRATGQPGQGAIPGAAARCTHSTTGAMSFTQQTAPATSYLGYAYAATASAAMAVEIHDRIMHMGGLSGTVTTAQTVALDVNANIASDNIAARIGDSNYSDIQWWAEWYTDTGGTGVNATINVTYNDGTSGDLTVLALPATTRASRLFSLNNLIPAAAAGKYIRDINTVTLSATTGAAGSFGFTATRLRGLIDVPVAGKAEPKDWAQLGLPEIANSSCLFPIVWCVTTSTGAVRGGGKVIHG
jgi:hypothetical protein